MRRTGRWRSSGGSYAAEMPADGHGAPHEADERAGKDAERRQRRVEEHRLDEVAVDDRPRDPGQRERDEPAENSLRQPFEEEGKPNETGGRADEPHDRDLPPAGEDGHANRRADADARNAADRSAGRASGNRRPGPTHVP